MKTRWKATAIDPEAVVRPTIVPLADTACWQCGHDAIAVLVRGDETAVRHRRAILDDCHSVKGVPR